MTWDLKWNTRKNDPQTLAEQIKYNYLNRTSWDASDMLNVLIGQGQSSYTPIQMANICQYLQMEGIKTKYLF